EDLRAIERDRGDPIGGGRKDERIGHGGSLEEDVPLYFSPPLRPPVAGESRGRPCGGSARAQRHVEPGGREVGRQALGRGSIEVAPNPDPVRRSFDEGYGVA